jgi:sterol desaturase/sphingolipid hydroxylase (fatty acid hydroxylase superfamily)
MIVSVVVQVIVWIWAALHLRAHGWPTFGEGIVNPYSSHLALHAITFPLVTMVTPLVFSMLGGGGVTRRSLLGLFDAFPNVLLALPAAALGFKAFLEGWLGDVVFTWDRPLSLFLVEGALYLILADLAFYASHRALHLRPLYRFHVTHHTHKAPTEAIVFFALSGTEAHVSGLFTLFFPLLFIRVHVVVWIVGAALILLCGCFIHDRGSVARSPRRILIGPAEHQLHHRRGRNNVNFGLMFRTCDRVFGTYADPGERA